MKRKCILIVILILIISMLSGCTGLFNLFFKKTGTPDRESNINQEIKKSRDWQKYVTDSEFRLGEEYTKALNDWLKYGTYPFIDGSTVCIPMAVEFAWQHLDLSDESAISFSRFSTTHIAYMNLLTGEYINGRRIFTNSKNIDMDYFHSVDLFIGTEPSDEELQLAKNKNIELIKKPVCYDAFVFITHKNNPVDSITVEQIKKIYSGKITNWSELGGKNEKIVPFQREANSGSQTAMENLVMKGTPMLPPETVVVYAEMGALVDGVAEYKNNSSSIGHTYLYYINVLYKNDNIKVLKIDGISPEKENFYNGSYPFTTNYYGVIKSTDKDNTGGRFLDWMLSDEGQECIEQAGYVPMEK